MPDEPQHPIVPLFNSRRVHWLWVAAVAPVLAVVIMAAMTIVEVIHG